MEKQQLSPICCSSSVATGSRKRSELLNIIEDTEIIEQIDRDVKHTYPDMHFFSGDSSVVKSNQEALRHMLIIFAKLNPGIRYVQGMNEILAPLYYVFRNDPDENNAVSSSLLWNKSSLKIKEGETKKIAVIVLSDDDSDESEEYVFETYTDECYEIDHTIFTRKLTFDDKADVSLVAEKGPVALRDFPHPRHLCGCFPFETTSHEIFCKKCFCCICEVPSPCSQWKGINGHCHLSKKITTGV